MDLKQSESERERRRIIMLTSLSLIGEASLCPVSVVAIWMALHQMDFLALGWQISQFPASLQELD
jgi:hypothetical protein